MAITDIQPGVPVFARDFGVVGDGTTDDTAAAQAALNYGSSNGRIVDFSNLQVAITSGLTCSGPGLKFDNHNSSPCFLPAGTGYTVLTVTGAPTCLRVAINGSGNAVNGIYLNNPQRASGTALQVNNLAGFGVKIDKCWDCVFETISIESCGTDVEWAFSMNDAGDTCNMTHILRLQVELANQQAIFISPNSLSCQVDEIHSERPFVPSSPPPGYKTWWLGANQGTFNVVRLAAADTDATVAFIDMAGSTVNQLRVEGLASTTVFNTWAGYTIFNAATMLGPSQTQSSGTSVFYGCAFTQHTSGADLTTGPDRYYSCGLPVYSVGISGHDVTNHQLFNCNLGELFSVDGTSAATFQDCVVTVHDNLSNQLFVGCSVSSSSGTLDMSYAPAVIQRCTISANISTSEAQVTVFETAIVGNLTNPGGWFGLIFDGSSFCTGSVSSGGPGNAPPNGATWTIGQRSYNLAPATGSPKSWVCTVSGTPGTWVSEGNL